MKFILLITAILLTLFATGSQSRADEVAQQARRVLAQKCFVCHGPNRNSKDAEETDLRLDVKLTGIEGARVIEEILKTPKS